MSEEKPPFLIYKVIDQSTRRTGLYRRYETHIIIDAPFEEVLSLDKIGLQYENSDPMFLKFFSFTQRIIDDKTYTVLVRESYELIEDER